MIKTIVAFTFTLIFLGVHCQSENTWVKKASFGGLKREKAIAFAIGDYGYVGCGVDTAEMTHNDLWEYTPSTDSWTQKASLPGSERKNAVAFVVEDKGYVGTGFSTDDALTGEKLKDFWAYDPSSNTWEAIADYPGGGDTGIYQATAFAVLNKGYVACGKIGSDAYIPQLWQYDPLLDSWTQKTPFPGGDRYQLISFALEEKAYVGLGTDHDVLRNDFYEYDPITNTWEEKPDFPGTERAKASTFTIGVKGFIVFGSDGGHKDELWEYNYYTESWTMRAPFAGSARSHGIAFSIGTTGYAGLGKGSSGKKRSFYAYTPVGPLSIKELNHKNIQIYPNPFKETLQVQLPSKITNGTYEIRDQSGRKIREHTFHSPTFTIPRNNQSKGHYYLILKETDGTPIGYKKLVII